MDRLRCRQVLMFLVILVGGTLLAACGTTSDPDVDTPAPASGEPAAPAAEPAADAERTLRVGWSRDLDVLDATVATSRFYRMFMYQLYTPLVYERVAGQLLPGLAHSWDVADDHASVTFFLRDDIDLTDGTHFDAHLLVASWERVLDPDTGSLHTGQFADFEGWDVIDDYTVTVHFEDPNMDPAAFFAERTGLWASPNSLDAVAAMGSDYVRQPVSYGAYMIESRTETQV
ncbi:MAG: ABC transporter substrate-binding protein, partial [Thermaerobacterales bacterium]